MRNGSVSAASEAVSETVSPVHGVGVATLVLQEWAIVD